MHTLNIQQLQSKIIKVAAAIIVVTGVAVAISVLLPIQSELRSASDAHIRHSLEIKKQAVEQYLARLGDIGRQIVSRTQIRKLLISYNRGKTSLKNFRAFSDPRLADALKEAPDAMGMVRLDQKLQAVSSVGIPPPQSMWVDASAATYSETLLGPQIYDGHSVVFAVSAIYDIAGERHGTDIVMFHLQELGDILTDGDGDKAGQRLSLLLKSDENEATAFGVFPGQEALSLKEPPLPWVSSEGIRASRDKVIVAVGADGVERGLISSPLDKFDWVLVETETTDSLYADARQTIWQVIVVIILMIGVGTFALLKTLQVLTGQVLLSTEQLRRQFMQRDRAQKQIIQAKNEAERANQAKSDFLASMSHELRTPLNAILGFGQLLQLDIGSNSNGKQKEHVQSILDGGEHLLNLVNQILDLAKIEASQTGLEIETVNAKSVVDDCASLTIPLGENRNVSITNTFDDATVMLKTDLLRFKQVLINLLSNAVAYNVEGGEVTILGDVTSNGYLRLQIKDTGVGIAQEKRAGVFNKFHRFHADPEIATEGIGIGLSVTKQLVDSMAGYINFESEEGVGSTFWFELPLATNEHAVIWDDSYRIGVEAIDKDHMHIVSLMNILNHGHLNAEELERAVEDLIAYTEYHFRREEAVMKVCQFPGLAHHCKLHRKVSEQIGFLEAEWRRERDMGMLIKLQELLQSIWLDHIVREDADIAEFTAGREVEITQELSNLDANGYS